MDKFTLVLCAFVFSLIVVIDAVAKRDRNDYTKRPHKLVCYFGSWAHYHETEPFEIEDIEYDLCTHVNYGFAKLNEWEYFIEYFDKFQDTSIDTWDKKGYERFVGLRKKNPNLTTMIALGGWWEGSEKYSDMATDPIKRKRFVDSVVEFLIKYDFDGLDMDWEYPANRGGVPGDKEHFIQLMTELKAAFEPHGFLLTAALSPGKPTIETAYILPKVNELVDWANVMTYDYHGGWENTLGHNAPINPRPEETDQLHQWFNVNFTVHYYLANGLEKSKFVMGIPFYGRGWTLLDSKHVALNDTAKGMSGIGYISREAGILGYNEICAMVEKDPKKWTMKSDPYYRAPYLYNETIWMGYETKPSVTCKVSFLKEMGLSGGMVWSLENDDFKNRCQGGRYPLLHTVHEGLNGGSISSRECDLYEPEPTTVPTTPTPTTTQPTTTTPEPTTVRITTPEPTTPRPTTPEPTTQRPTTVEPTTERRTEAPTTQKATTAQQTARTVYITEHIGDYVVGCSEEGYQPHPTDKHKFIQCEFIDEGPRHGWYIHIMPCAPGTKWNQGIEECDDDNYYKIYKLLEKE